MSRRITTVSAALILALIGTMLVVVYVGRADARALAGVETVDVVVAKGALEQGLTVEAAQAQDLIGVEQMPRKAVPADAMTSLTTEDTSLVFASDVTAGEMLRRARLVQAVAPTDELVIPDGKLAVTVQLEDPARVGGFVKVGSEIAIFDSYNVMEGNEGSSRTPSGDHLADDFPKNKATRVLLPRVIVLAVGSTLSATPTAPAESEDAATEVADPLQAMVTVAVTQREAEKLIHGIQTGTLYLGLLGTAQVEPGPGVDNRTLFNQ